MASTSSWHKKPAKTLDGRLLCASALAYDVRQPYLSGAGFVSKSQPRRVTKGVNSCLVGLTQDGIVIAFRGTTPEALDWLQNASATLITSRDVDPKDRGSVSRRIPKGRVHKGFYRALYSTGFSMQIQQTLKQLLPSPSSSCNKSSQYKPKNCKIYLTGHSKGGALASLYALELLNNPDLPNPTYVCTFGAPRLGDTAFADYFGRQISQTAYENHLDIIPFLPPSSNDDRSSEMMTTFMADVQADEKKTCRASASCSGRETKQWSYAPLGNRKYITRGGTVMHKVSRELDNRRIREIEGKTILSLADFRQAHCSACPDASRGCYGGYFRALAPEICALI